MLLLISFLELWKHPENRRRFFQDYASENGFDPLNPENWYTQPHSKVMAVRVYSIFYSSSLLCFGFLTILVLLMYTQ